MSNAINSNRTYDIVYAEDYNRLIDLLSKDLSRRGYSYSPSYSASSDSVNTKQVIESITTNAKKIGYSSSESYGDIVASQMQRLESFIKSKAREILVK